MKGVRGGDGGQAVLDLVLLIGLAQEYGATLFSDVWRWRVSLVLVGTLA